MLKPRCAARIAICIASCLFLLTRVPDLHAQMVAGSKMPGYAEAFGLPSSIPANALEIQELNFQTPSGSMANVLLPGERGELTLRFANRGKEAIHGQAELEIIRYSTHIPRGDVWTPHVVREAIEGSANLKLDVPASGSLIVPITPEIPERFGGYALVFAMQGQPRILAALITRVIATEGGRVQFPTFALDTTYPDRMNEGVFSLYERLGVRGARMGASYTPASAPEHAAATAEVDRTVAWARRHNLTVMMTLSNGSTTTQPLGRPRPWLDQENRMLKGKTDTAWMPQYDEDFERWVTQLASKYGWPQGNLHGMELWNEPWESTSISNWGADMERYREIYTHMAQGVLRARREAGIQVLIGGAGSSSNTRDKLFPDGTDHFLPWLDFVSIHYQALSADPVLVPEWMNRRSPEGPVRVWDTESWMANSEDRVAAFVASERAEGVSRVTPIYYGNVFDSRNVQVDGKTYPVVQTWAPAAAVAACQHFIGQRPFHEVLFQNGLPWIFVFDGLARNGSVQPDDGTLVVVGDLRDTYEPERTLFRNIAISPSASLALQDPRNEFHLYDALGNEIAEAGGALTVPLNGKAYFLQANGSGSFAQLVSAARTARIAGYEPVDIVAHDLTAPLNLHPSLRIALTNVLNRTVEGTLHVELGHLQLEHSDLALRLEPGQTRELLLPVHGGVADPANRYPLTVTFDAGSDGTAEHKEDLHVNWISHRTIKIDGDLSDWNGVLPQLLPGTALSRNVTEAAWLPYRTSTENALDGDASAYLAYDDQFFYFAAKIVDRTPDAGMLRFSARNDDSYFYPDKVTTPDGHTLTWPSGVRHFSYRRHFETPSGNSEHDNVQIAFNVFDRKPWFTHPRGVPPGYMVYLDTDYEYALNPVADRFGGGAEVWRLQAPGIPRKHFFPRQPKAPIDGGPVGEAKLVMRREGNLRIVEAAIPWKEVPGVYTRMLAHQTIKFSCRINDNKTPARELAAGRSVSRSNTFTFHDDWKTHWSNELEFAFER